MNKNKGFTLIELLAVIVILGIMLAISVVAVNKIRGNQEDENRRNVISSILTGAKRYVSENRNALDGLSATNNKTIKVSNIKSNDFVDFDEIEYPDFKNKGVTVSLCSDDSVKLKYSFEGYNDCGCKEQEAGIADKICED